jgi:ubiquinone/menaquinone biosynthesis C-methylase UbiE
MEQRKLDEIAWADKRRTIDPSDQQTARKYLANRKYYSVVRATQEFVHTWLRENCRDRDVFEMACGNGCYTRLIADIARSCTAADIAPLSIEQAKAAAKENPTWQRINYLVLDCENTKLPDNSFDVLCEGGALHHMDLNAACREAVRLLRPGGKFMCVEAIRHNPIIHLYRKLTPHLRTAWEADHILGRPEIRFVASFFERIEIRLFHISTLFAVPLRGTPLFNPVLTTFERIDRVLTRCPGFRWMAWQAAFILSNPKKDKLNSPMRNAA